MLYPQWSGGAVIKLLQKLRREMVVVYISQISDVFHKVVKGLNLMWEERV